MGIKQTLGIVGLLATLVPVAVALPAGGAGAGTPTGVMVTTTADELTVDGDCALREAIETVNTGVGFDTCAPGSSTIVLPAGSFAYDAAGLGVLTVETSTSITGAGAGSTSIQETFFGTALQASAGAALTLENLGVRGGTAVRMQTGAGLLRLVDAEADGYDYSVLTDDSDVDLLRSELASATYGSALTTSGDITVDRSAILGDNESYGLATASGSITVTDSTLSGPVVGLSVDIRRSYIDHCVECSPLPIGAGALYLENSTVVVPLYNPAIYLTTGTATIVSSTVYSDSEVAIIVGAGGSATVTGSIINCDSATGLVSGGGNVSNGLCGFTGPGDEVGDPMLGTLADNGGPTKTWTLLPGSRARDNAPTCPSMDQRGQPRPRDGDGDGAAACDSGAFEAPDSPPPPPPPPPPPFTVKPVVGDWNGDGIDTAGYVSGTFWNLRNSFLSYAINDMSIGLAGTSTGTPVVGDWDGDGDDNIGFVVQEPTRLRWHLQTEPDASFQADIVISYGRTGTPVVGDWNGDGTDDIGVVQGDRWFLRTSLTPGPANLSATLGVVGDIPIVGDWNGDGTDTIGVLRGRTRFLKNTVAGGPADLTFRYGATTDLALAGDWNDDGIDTPGIARNTSTGIAWYLRNTNTPGVGEIYFRFGP